MEVANHVAKRSMCYTRSHSLSIFLLHAMSTAMLSTTKTQNVSYGEFGIPISVALYHVCSHDCIVVYDTVSTVCSMSSILSANLKRARDGYFPRFFSYLFLCRRDHKKQGRGRRPPLLNLCLQVLLAEHGDDRLAARPGQGADECDEEGDASERGAVLVRLELELRLVAVRQQEEQHERQGAEHGSANGDVPHAVHVAALDGRVAHVPAGDVGEDVTQGRGDAERDVAQRGEHGVGGALGAAGAELHVHDADGQELDAVDVRAHDVIAEGEEVVADAQAAVEMEDEHELQQREGSAEQRRGDVDVAPGGLEEKLLEGHDAEEGHDGAGGGHDAEGPGREAQVELQEGAPGHVGDLHDVVDVHEGHGHPDGVERDGVPDVAALLGHALGPRLAERLLPHHVREGHDEEQREDAEHEANLREAEAPAPGVLVVHQRSRAGAEHRAEEPQRVAGGLHLPAALAGLVARALDRQGVGHDVHHDLAHGGDPHERREALHGRLAQRREHEEAHRVHERPDDHVGLAARAEHGLHVREEAEEQLEAPGQRREHVQRVLRRRLGVQVLHHVHLQRRRDERRRDADEEVGCGEAQRHRRPEVRELRPRRG
mmetsp:Transcript_20792/g.63258  ORF Transcript_20792/g.63258 Transcript_20792/m.63258 type:complete len:601 (-) Transcript_20792:702-2504(-)